MTLDFFKDSLFDLLNESDQIDAAEIEADDAAGTFLVTAADGSRFFVLCRAANSTDSGQEA